MTDTNIVTKAFITQRDFDTNAIIETTTNIGTNETTKQIQIIKPEVTLPITSDIPSKALMLSDLAKLEEFCHRHFKLSKNKF